MLLGAMTGAQARRYHRLLQVVNTGLYYDREGDHRLTVRQREYWLRVARWIRTGELPWGNIWQLAGTCSANKDEQQQRRTVALAECLR